MEEVKSPMWWTIRLLFSAVSPLSHRQSIPYYTEPELGCRWQATCLIWIDEEVRGCGTGEGWGDSSGKGNNLWICFIMEVIWKATDTPWSGHIKYPCYGKRKVWLSAKRQCAGCPWVGILEPFFFFFFYTCTSSHAGLRPSPSQPGGGARELGWVSSPVLCPCPWLLCSLFLLSLGCCLLQVPLSPCPAPGDTEPGMDPRNGRITVRPNDTGCMRGQGRPATFLPQPWSLVNELTDLPRAGVLSKSPQFPEIHLILSSLG